MQSKLEISFWKNDGTTSFIDFLTHRCSGNNLVFGSNRRNTPPGGKGDSGLDRGGAFFVPSSSSFILTLPPAAAGTEAKEEGPFHLRNFKFFVGGGE